jgi:hypothetical protein
MSERFRHHYIVFAIFAIPGVSEAESASSSFAPNWKPTLAIPRTTESIRIDGELDDRGWQGAARATGFAEVDPGDQVEPAVRSEAWITYDEHHLYVALLAQDDPSAVRASVCERDDIFTDDYFGVMLDTYGDLNWGYELFVNPLGIQGDLRLLSDGNEDIAFDLVFDSRGRVTDEGYQVELAIPFSSLRFPDRPEHTWRLNFWRDQQRDLRRRYAWAAVDRDNACWMCSWGSVTGIAGVEPASNIDLIPTAIAFQSGRRADIDDPTSDFSNDDPDGELSLNVRYGITSGSSAEIAINPDFSQVESDADEIDVNSPFALFFDERRPFFQEGSNLYSTWISAIYTRTINNPNGAAKFTGQFGNTSVLYLGGHDANATLIVPTEERSFFFEADEAVSNIGRAIQAYGEASYVGGLVTDRRLSGALDGSSTTFGVDGRHRITDRLQVEYQLLGSHTQEPSDTTRTPELQGVLFDDEHSVGFDGESYDGHAGYLSLESDGRVWSHGIDYWEYSPTFRTDTGFTTRTGYRVVAIDEGVFFRPNRGFLVTWGADLGIGREWNYRTNGIEDGWVRPSLSFTFPQQTNLFVEGLVSGERFRGRMFNDIRTFLVDVNTRPSEGVQLGSFLRFGKLIARNVDEPFLGDAFIAEAWASLRATKRLSIDPNWEYQEMGRPVEGGKLFSGFVLRTRLNYQFTRELVVRLVTQYNSFSDQFEVDPLLTYRVNPFTVFYAGATSDYSHYDGSNPASPGAGDEWELTDRQFFAKMQYLFRL